MEATTIHSFYDPLICKLITWDENREDARNKMIGALDQFIIHGIRTNIGYLKQLLIHPAYRRNEITTKYCDEHTADLVAALKTDKEVIPHYIPGLAYYLYDFNWRQEAEINAGHDIWNHISYWRDIMELKGSVEGAPFKFSIESIKKGTYHILAADGRHDAQVRICGEGYLELILDQKQMEFFISTDEEGTGHVSYQGFIFRVKRNDLLISNQEILGSFDSGGGKNDGKIISPMPGKVIQIKVEKGDKVIRGQTLLIVEAMKMENYIAAPTDGVVEQVNVRVGEMVNSSTRLVQIK